MPHTEKEILDTLRSDTDAAFAMLLERFQEPIYWHVRRLVVSHHDTEDVVQEAFVRVYRGLPRFGQHSSLSTWVYRIATNEALRWLKRRKVRDFLFVEAGQQATAQEPYIDYGNLEAIALQRAIAALPPKQRLVFNLCYYDELDYEQVAAIVGCKPSAAKANYHLAKKSVKEFLTANLNL